jgi:hypothetical protein
MAYDSNVTSTVEYGTEAGNLGEISTMGVTKTYRFLWYSSGWMHHVVLGPLRDSTTYFYRCGGFGPVLNFTTPPPPGPNVSVKFAVVGNCSKLMISDPQKCGCIYLSPCTFSNYMSGLQL